MMAVDSKWLIWIEKQYPGRGPSLSCPPTTKDFTARLVKPFLYGRCSVFSDRPDLTTAATLWAIPAS